jgi:hypothetical protein
MLAGQSKIESMQSRHLDKESWQQHVESYQKSKQTKAAYCKKHNLVYHQFTYWCHRLKRKQASSEIPKNSSAFIPIKIKSDSLRVTPLCTLEFDDGKRLLIHDVLVVKELIGRL